MPKSKTKYITFVPKANGFRALSGDNTRKCETLMSASPAELQAFYELTQSVKLKIKTSLVNPGGANAETNTTVRGNYICLGFLEKALHQSNSVKMSMLREIKALAKKNNKTPTEVYEDMMWRTSIKILTEEFQNENNNLYTV
jgi:hypothetical protein